MVTIYADDLEKNFASFFHIDAVTSKANGLADLTALVTGLRADREPDVATPPEALRAI
jgi:hypothetical protein